MMWENPTGYDPVVECQESDEEQCPQRTNVGWMTVITEEQYIIEELAKAGDIDIVAVIERSTKRPVGIKRAIRAGYNPVTYEILGDADVEEIYYADYYNATTMLELAERIYKKNLNSANYRSYIEDITRIVSLKMSEMASIIKGKKALPVRYSMTIHFDDIRFAFSPGKSRNGLNVQASISNKDNGCIFTTIDLEVSKDALNNILRGLKANLTAAMSYLLAYLDVPSPMKEHISEDIMPNIDFKAEFFIPTVHALKVQLGNGFSSVFRDLSVSIYFNGESIAINNTILFKKYEVLSIDLARTIIGEDFQRIADEISRILTEFAKDFEDLSDVEPCFHVFPEELEDLTR